ncbi:MAG: O-antigen ligase family protein [Bacteroidetes bacterium]|nr:O-antigen ligase family protein [Bacteroidota bacterium]MBU1114855.1 O-antigen ligase family protein [Bacteroidota bacterium]MBU1800462.1 O-antigen ligase family protein [Bacteroidota bacterium]
METLFLKISYYKHFCKNQQNCKDILVSTLAIVYVFFVHIPASEILFFDFRAIIALILFFLLYSDLKNISFANLSIPILCMISLFFIYMLISISWSLNMDYGYYKAFGILLDIVPTIAISIVLFANSKYLKNEGIVFITQILGLILTALIILQGGLNYADISKNIFSFGHIGYGRFLGFAFIVGMYAFLKSKEKYSILLFTNSIVFFGLFLSGHRSSLFGAFFFSFVLFIANLFISRPFYKETLIKYFTLIAVSIILVLLFTNKFTDSLTRNKSLLISSYNDIKSDGSFNARLILYDFSIMSIKENPFCGVGLGGFNSNDVRKEYFYLKYPHNIFLDILTEEGAIGFLLFVSILFLLMVKLPPVIIYWVVLLYGLWLSLFYGVLHDHKLIFVFFYFLIAKKSYLDEINQKKITE